MPDFSNITLVSVTGLNDAHGAALALEFSRRQMPGASALLLSPSAPGNLPPDIRHRAIAPLSFKEYSLFMMFALWRMVETEYVLIVQEDGWLLDASNWTDEFLEYDYIGAPGHLARVDRPEGIYWKKDFSWYGDLENPDSVVIPVLNGGFSLRSRRMLRALVDHPHIRMVVPPPDVRDSEPIAMSWFNDATHEDVQLTCMLRPELEAVGLRFAPLEVAARFGFEHAALSHIGVNLHAVFGMHGSWRRLASIDPPVVRYGATRRHIDEHPLEPPVVKMLEERGYRLEFMPEPA
ncbi:MULTISPECIES: DUF5672 family protein [Caballeronia]|uniref:DUF5672 family protein n=1 Tax=Caballeronia TaxID=1827195 RepID=UPI001588C564|nr:MULTISPECIES: DUF5672 family protein [Caballeronia]MCG7404446.1 glycosyl transferase family 17 [Caballeronia zhejiangensis]MCI1045987.1 glycosyl transferase family 17 [Caballeronia zhejiangensis]